MDSWNGVPENDEFDGWHWLKLSKIDMPAFWNATKRTWHNLPLGGSGDADGVSKKFTYNGPCLMRGKRN